MLPMQRARGSQQSSSFSSLSCYWGVVTWWDRKASGTGLVRVRRQADVLYLAGSPRRTSRTVQSPFITTPLRVNISETLTITASIDGADYVKLRHIVRPIPKASLQHLRHVLSAFFTSSANFTAKFLTAHMVPILASFSD